MRDLVRVVNLDAIDEFGSVAAVAELTVLVAGHELRLRGAAIVRSGGDFRLSWPRYKHPKSVEKLPTWEPRGELRRAIEEVVLQYWRDRRAADRRIGAALSRDPGDVELFAEERK